MPPGPPTRPPSPDYPSAATLERRHEEDGRWKARFQEKFDKVRQELNALEGRVQKLEWQTDANTLRLNEGSETLAKLKQRPYVWALTLVSAILIPAATWIWYAAKYPDRKEFNEVRQDVTEIQIKLPRVEDAVKNIQDDVSSLKAEQKVATEKILDKLDEVQRESRTRRDALGRRPR